MGDTGDVYEKGISPIAGAPETNQKDGGFPTESGVLSAGLRQSQSDAGTKDSIVESRCVGGASSRRSGSARPSPETRRPAAPTDRTASAAVPARSQYAAQARECQPTFTWSRASPRTGANARDLAPVPLYMLPARSSVARTTRPGTRADHRQALLWQLAPRSERCPSSSQRRVPPESVEKTDASAKAI